MDKQTTSNGRGVPLANGDLSAVAKAVADIIAQEAAEPKKIPSLRQRMAALRADAFGIGKDDIEMEFKDKDGNKRKTKIKGHTIEAVLSEMRPLFVRHGIDLTPNLVERTYSGNRCDVLVDFEFTNLDDETEKRVIRWAGAGTDNGDKAFAKAGTNAMKEMLKKVFLVTDRDDAKEEEEQVEFQTPESVSRSELERERNRGRAALEKWATTFKAAIETAGSVKDVQRLERDNKDQLISQELPDVTRTFFVDLIEKRKKELTNE